MNIQQEFIPAGCGNRPAGANPCHYITIHNTGNTSRGANAKSHAGYVKSDTAALAPVSWHYTVDDMAVYQHLPDTETAFHAGDGGGPGNTTSIGIEICMNCDGDLLRATDNAAALAAELCAAHGIPVERVVQHNRWSGKNCPQMLRAGRPYDWEQFIGKVRARLCAPEPTVTFALGKVRLDLFGQRTVELSGGLAEGVHYVGLRALLEAMEFEVGWVPETRTATVSVPRALGR